MIMRRIILLATFVTLMVGITSSLRAGDWPMWRYDAGRSAASRDDLPKQLALHWVRHYDQRVQAWDDPLNLDLMQYDKVFEPVVLRDRVFVGFNDSDKVVALGVGTGQEVWAFYTDGPVRFPPAGSKENLFFTSDDGYLYCVQAADGTLVWKLRGGPSERKVLGNRRVISIWPARGGPVVRDGTVYFAASVWPFMGTFIYAVDAANGKVQWVNDETGAQYIKQPHSAPAFAGVAPQGALVATKDFLLVPGGRSVPAAFDRKSGQLRYFHINDGGKGTGGSLVMADDSAFYVHTRGRGVRRIELESGVKSDVTMNEPVLAKDTVYTATDKAVMELDSEQKVKWQLDVDGSGDLIRAGSRLYAAGKDSIVAISLPRDGQPASVVWSLPVDGRVLRLVAGAGKLLAVTEDGRILAYGAVEPDRPVAEYHAPSSPALAEVDSDIRNTLRSHDADQGYALCYGVDDGGFLDRLLASTGLHVIAVEPDILKVERMRERYDAAGIYGKRVVVHQGDPLTFHAPPYIANLVAVGKSQAAAYATPEYLKAMYASVRPYGGLLWIPLAGDEQSKIAQLLQEGLLDRAKLVASPSRLLVIREDALPGSAPWTHQNGNIANTIKSDDQRVKLPLGVLWFGGNSNMDILPRHGHGPPPQVIGGRQIIQGINSLSARDVYTGRVLWKRLFEDLGTYDIYYDETYADTPLDTAYNQVHIPGANARGTNYVATDDRVYLIQRNRCQVLDPRSGDTIQVIALPPGADGSAPGQWTYIGVYDDILLAGTEFANYTRRLEGVQYKPEKKKGTAWSPDWFGSLGLVAFNRYSGEVLWKADAMHSFLHNGIVAGNGRVYVLDKLPKSVEDQLARRGQSHPDTYRLVAMDVRSGDVLWETSHEVFGTWLGYSAEHDILLQAGAAASDRSPDEVDCGMITYRGQDGSPIWKQMDLKYAGPCILYHDRIITNSRSNASTSGVFSLLDGSPVRIANPITGKDEPWQYLRTYGCNTAVASEHLLTFRSGAAGYYDLSAQCGVGNLGGFRSGCSSNLIAADGVLNAPDYTRTCTCGYQNQTSLGLIHMPDVETWTVSQLGGLDDAGWLQRIGINRGAPGDRRADDGTVWFEYPLVADDSIPVTIAVVGNGMETFRRHASAAQGAGPAWVASSGVRNVNLVSILLQKMTGGEANGQNPPTYTLRLHFAEPDDLAAGERVFDVALQGQTVLKDFDVVKQADGRMRGIVKEFRGVKLMGYLTIALTAKVGQKHGPILSGIELIAEKET